MCMSLVDFWGVSLGLWGEGWLLLALVLIQVVSVLSTPSPTVKVAILTMGILEGTASLKKLIRSLWPSGIVLASCSLIQASKLLISLLCLLRKTLTKKLRCRIFEKFIFISQVHQGGIQTLNSISAAFPVHLHQGVAEQFEGSLCCLHSSLRGELAFGSFL